MPGILKTLLRPRVLATAALVVLLWFGWHFLFVWTPENVVAARQEKFFKSLSSKKWDRCGRYLSEDYRDRWNFNRDDALLALRDVGSQFFFLQVQGSEFEFHPGISAREARAHRRVKIEGTGGPLAQVIMSHANRVQEPFVFHWRKESWWPTTWRITRIENAGIPEALYDYRPGDLQRAMSNQSSRSLLEDIR